MSDITKVKADCYDLLKENQKLTRACENLGNSLASIGKLLAIPKIGRSPNQPLDVAGILDGVESLQQSFRAVVLEGDCKDTQPKYVNNSAS